MKTMAMAALATAAFLLPAQAETNNGGIVTLSPGAKQVLAFTSPVKSFHIANPDVIDAQSMDSQHVVVIGKAPGFSAVAAYDAAGQKIYSNDVEVGSFGRVKTKKKNVIPGQVIYQRGLKQVIYICGAEGCSAQAPADQDQQDQQNNTPPSNQQAQQQQSYQQR